MNNEDVLKVFHAGGQDLEIIHNLTGHTPYPLFDTQVAAMALGHGEQIGYSNLVEMLLGTASTRARGLPIGPPAARPEADRLRDRDVTHLAQLFPDGRKLKKTGRGAWLDEEMERLADPSSFAFEPSEAWKRIQLPSRKPEVLGRLKAIAAWREPRPAEGLPRGRSSRTRRLTISSSTRHVQDDLGRVRGLSPGGGTTTSADG